MLPRPDLASSARLFATLALVGTAACVRAPAVVIVDRKTALEQQASGSFRGLEEELLQEGASARPTPLTSEQLSEAGVSEGGGDSAAELAASDDAGAAGSDATRTDGLLVQRCIGEARDGTLALTIDACTGTIDVPEVNRLIERVNRERRQRWRWLEEHAGGKSPEAVRAAWREVHLRGLICGAQLQLASEAWEIKKC